MNLTLIPFDLPGKIYRSPMPFGAFDEERTTLKEYQLAGVSHVVMLTAPGEDLIHAGRDLTEVYAGLGMTVLHFPIEDFDTPEDLANLALTIDQITALVSSGNSIAIHCYAGRGRTGMVIALLARRILGLDGLQAVSWVRSFFPAIETEEQLELVLRGLPNSQV